MDFGHSSFNGGWQEVWVRSYEIRITSAGIVFYRIPLMPTRTVATAKLVTVVTPAMGASPGRIPTRTVASPADGRAGTLAVNTVTVQFM